MTKYFNVKKVLILGAFLGLAACAKEGDNLGSQASPEETTQETAFDPSQQPETDLASDPTAEPSAMSMSEKQSILKTYDYVDPSRQIKTQALENAMLYYHKNKAKIRNKKYVSVLDFSKHSSKKRFHIIDMESGKVWSIHVAHGKGSDSNHDGYAEKFSNKSGSQASSLGYYLTGSTYQGGNGLSLRLDGLSSTNSAARGRAVVIHGAKYVREADVKQGRSWGCPAVAMELRTQVINMLKGGSLIYAIN